MPAWLAASTEAEQEIILSSGIRLIRNFKDYPMPQSAGREQLLELKGKLAPLLEGLCTTVGFQAWDMERLSDLDIGLLYEKHALPTVEYQDLKAMYLYTDACFQMRILLNYREHLNMQNLGVGLKLKELYEELSALEDGVEKCAEFAFSPRYGYLSHKVSEAGTGLRASVVLHLPALVGLEKIKKVAEAAGKLNLSFKRLYHDETKYALGNLYVLYNRGGVGEIESEIIEKVSSAALDIANRELQMRKMVMRKSELVAENQIWRAVGILQNARLLTAAEMLAMLSYIGLGIDLKLLKKISWLKLKKLMVQARSSHLQALYPEEDTDRIRAGLLREALKEV